MSDPEGPTIDNVVPSGTTNDTEQGYSVHCPVRGTADFGSRREGEEGAYHGPSACPAGNHIESFASWTLLLYNEKKSSQGDETPIRCVNDFF